jgi:hypothetical protein
LPPGVALSLCLLAVCPTRAQTITWSPIDCAKSDIVLDRIEKCWLSNSYSGSDGRGEYHLQIAAFNTGTEKVYVYLHKPRVELQTGGIAVPTEAERESYLSKPSAEAQKFGGNFSETMRTKYGYAKTYALAYGWQCFSFLKDAPPLGAQGIAYYLAGYACTKSIRVQTAEAIDAFLEKLSVHR